MHGTTTWQPTSPECHDQLHCNRHPWRDQNPTTTLTKASRTEWPWLMLHTPTAALFTGTVKCSERSKPVRQTADIIRHRRTSKLGRKCGRRWETRGTSRHAAIYCWQLAKNKINHSRKVASNTWHDLLSKHLNYVSQLSPAESSPSGIKFFSDNSVFQHWSFFYFAFYEYRDADNLWEPASRRHARVRANKIIIASQSERDTLNGDGVSEVMTFFQKFYRTINFLTAFCVLKKSLRSQPWPRNIFCFERFSPNNLIEICAPAARSFDFKPRTR